MAQPLLPPPGRQLSAALNVFAGARLGVWVQGLDAKPKMTGFAPGHPFSRGAGPSASGFMTAHEPICPK